MTSTALNVGCRAMLLACERLGLDTEAMLEAHGLTRSQLDDPDGRLPSESARALWDSAYRAAQNPVFALDVAESIPTGAYRVLEYVIASAPTVGAAFSKIGAYFHWVDTSVQLPVGPCGESYAIGIEVEAPPELVPLRALEFTFATCLLKVRALTGHNIAVSRIEAATVAPQHHALLERFFGCPWRFQTGHNRMCFDAETWALPSANADASLLGVLERHAQELVASLQTEPELVGRVRRVLYQRGPSLSLAATAKELGLSARTLQRRLTEAGHVFATVADAVRQDLASRMLAERGVAIAEVAFLLGFADQSSFTRTFKRWTGLTPAAFRQARQG
jgi:AraC-like DNA-binding protein